MLALGVREYARTSGSIAARVEQVKITFLAGILILLGVTAGVLAVLFIIVIVLVEIWRPLLVVLTVIAGLAPTSFGPDAPRRERAATKRGVMIYTISLHCSASPLVSS